MDFCVCQVFFPPDTWADDNMRTPERIALKCLPYLPHIFGRNNVVFRLPGWNFCFQLYAFFAL